MINLDDRAAVIKLQGGEGVINSVDGFSNQLDQSWSESQNIKIPDDYKKSQKILVAGMGGSRFPALIIKDLFKGDLTVPLDINDNYILPGWVDKNTLVVLSSYSGTTEEVLTCADEAQKRGANLLGITSGGEIERLSKDTGFPAYIFTPTYNPSEQPRIGVGYGVGGLLGLLYQLGFIKIDGQTITSAINNLDNLLSSNKLPVASDQNPAKQMAKSLMGRYPYFVVAEHLTGVGNAVQNQVNETAKSISSYRVIPEINHHLMEGLKFPHDHSKLALFVFFNSSLYSDSVKKRFTITREVVEQNDISTLWCDLQGATPVEQVFELLGFSGYMTMYLSALYGQDPTAIPYVDYFKKKLKEAQRPGD